MVRYKSTTSYSSESHRKRFSNIPIKLSHHQAEPSSRVVIFFLLEIWSKHRLRIFLCGQLAQYYIPNIFKIAYSLSARNTRRRRTGRV